MSPDSAFTYGLINTIGKWKISTARYGIGCVAHREYEGHHDVNIGGESFDKLVLIITVDRRRFLTKLDGSDEDASDIEVALRNRRWGQVQPYGYRGTSGAVLDIDKPFLAGFAISKILKVLERGQEKLSIPLDNPKAVIAKLRACFDAQ